MLDRNTQTILRNWQEGWQRDFGRKTLVMHHNLHLSPLFDDDALIRLLDGAGRADYHLNLMDGGRRREGQFGDLSGAEILRAVRNGDIWINLRAPGRVDPAYDHLLDDIYDEIENRVPGLETFKRSFTILISSPNVHVKYHFDVPGQSLWQVRGTKRVRVYPNRPPFLTQDWLEKVILNEAHETDVTYEAAFEDSATIMDLTPGEWSHWPLNSPHMIDNHDCMNVSLTTEHWSRELRNAYAVNYANGIMRKLGLSSAARPESGAGLWVRLALAGAVKFGGIQKRAAKPYIADFTLDPDAPRGIRDIEPVRFDV